MARKMSRYFHAESGNPTPVAGQLVRLWWIPDDQAEATKWKTEVEALGGVVIESRIEPFDRTFIFDIDVHVAMRQWYTEDDLLSSALIFETP